jgi:hypothetical protein
MHLRAEELITSQQELNCAELVHLTMLKVTLIIRNRMIWWRWKMMGERHGRWDRGLIRGAQMSGVRSMWQLNFWQWCLMFVGSQYHVTILASRILSWLLDFWKIHAPLALVSCIKETREVIDLGAWGLRNKEVFVLKNDQISERRWMIRDQESWKDS